jgi:hypothetical protein
MFLENLNNCALRPNLVSIRTYNKKSTSTKNNTKYHNKNDKNR